MSTGESPRSSSAPGAYSSRDKARGDHLIPLVDGWSLWRTACLRGAGFSVDGLTPLVAADTDSAIECLLTEEATRDTALSGAREICWTKVRALEGDARRPWRRILRRLDKGAIPDNIPDDAEFASALATLTDAAATVERAHAAYAQAFEGDALITDRALRAAAAEPRLREAVTWQNRHALKTGLDHLLRQPAQRRNSQTRQHALLVVRYLQRYCTTNESIGFFGPVGWGVFVEHAPAIDLRPGLSLLAARVVRFEYWMIDALADILLRDPAFRAALPPRLAPTMRIEGNVLHGPLGRRIPLDAERLALLRILDGKTTAAELAEQLVADPAFGSHTRASSFALLDRLARAGVIIWRPSIPVGEHPERALRECLDGIGDGAVREQLSAPLDRLVAARDNVASAAGDPVALDSAMADLESAFRDITGGTPRRNEGRVYAGRTLVYEDCRRDIDLTIGPELLARLGPPLTLVLHSARWFTWQLARQYLEFVTATFQRCQQETGQSAVALEHLWTRLQAEVDIVRLIVDDVAEQIHERWAPILAAVSAESRNVQLSAAAIRTQVQEAFAAPRPGWPGARYHSPDVMIAADSAEAICAGRYLLVLGEIHISGNSISQNVFLNLHPRPDELLDSLERDAPDPELVPIFPRRRAGHRMAHDPHTRNNFHIAFDDSASWRQPERVLPISSLVVEDLADGLVIRSRDHVHRFPAIAFFGPQMTGLCLNHFGIVAPRPYSPRVTIDHLVVGRESWRFALSDLGFLTARSAADRYAAARRWARAHGLPRRLFARVPGEKKPIYVDLKSPISVDVLAKMLRGAVDQPDRELSVSEMLPTLEQTWLTDAEGRRYTSELRIAALDPLAWHEQ